MTDAASGAGEPAGSSRTAATPSGADTGERADGAGSPSRRAELTVGAGLLLVVVGTAAHFLGLV